MHVSEIDVEPVRLTRFGVFVFDSARLELRRNGAPVRLQDKPARVLARLLEQPGEVVAREQLCRHLWPAGTYVEFEASLNNAVRRLREVLGDSAETPRFVETVARRGYRFVAPAGPATPPALAVARGRWLGPVLLVLAVLAATMPWRASRP